MANVAPAFVFAPYVVGVLLGSHAFNSGDERILELERRELERRELERLRR